MTTIRLLPLLLLLHGCGTYQINRLPASAPLSKPSAIVVDGDYTHAPSKYHFPTQVNGFARVALTRYDTEGLHMSAGYNGGTAQCLVALTIYVYPTPRMSFVGAAPDVVRSLDAQWLNAAYSHAKREIEAAHPRASLQVEDANDQNGTPAKKAVYLFDDRASELFVFVVDHMWFLKYRITYPSACSIQAREQIQQFFSAWRRRVS